MGILYIYLNICYYNREITKIRVIYTIKSKKLLGSVMAFSLVMSMSISSVANASQDIGYFSNFTVTFSGGERVTGERYKQIDNEKAVVNLKEDSGDAWISATLRNSDGAARGSTEL